ncbi:RNA-directed DNA polymerase [Enterococcus cecorum]|uniref:RNA-directed DNA polymerase n=1 Tax=Enterococcus cecorum TaxID=44008 RepID=UPI002ACA04BF|nr:RNA-directed DNA polymerase [Enterococcus cecorum]MDZ5560901.1 RNA-directed DNA polymerase [Enterococcus cecorum]
MKRVGNLYVKITSLDNLALAHRHAKRGKGWYREVREIDADPDSYLNELQRLLLTQSYQTSEYFTFTKREKDKERVIYKLPYFPDRVCQWAIIQVIEPYLIKYMTRDTYSAIPGRGIHACKDRVQCDMRRDPEGTKYCLKLDVRKFYPSINHDVLKQTYRRLFKDKELLWLLDEIIDSTPGDTGIPIGNYLSQYSGNLYLARFDHYVKEVLRVKYYYRYMDDMVILGPDKAELHRLKVVIEDYLKRELKLQLKSNWQVFPTQVRGVDFVGYRIFKDYVLLRKSIALDFKRKMRKMANKKALSDHDHATIQAYKGWLKHCNSYNLTQKYLAPLETEEEERT